MKKEKDVIGIDISKLKLDVTILRASRKAKPIHFVVRNCAKGISKLFDRVADLGIKIEKSIICFEDTGVYSMPLCFYFQNEGISYFMESALEIHRSQGIVRGKNDKLDSMKIAIHARTHIDKMVPKSLPVDILLRLKTLVTERDRIVLTIGGFKRGREAKGFIPEELIEESMGINTEIVVYLKTMLKRIDKLIQDLIMSSKELSKQYDLALSVPGVGPQTAILLLIFTRGFTAFENWRKLACYSGIAPFEHTSGSSVRGKTKVSSLANKKLKTTLHMAALTAKTYDPQLKVYYQRKIDEGKPPLLVLNAVKCKVISRVFATVNRGTPYVVLDKIRA